MNKFEEGILALFKAANTVEPVFVKSEKGTAIFGASEFLLAALVDIFSSKGTAPSAPQTPPAA